MNSAKAVIRRAVPQLPINFNGRRLALRIVIPTLVLAAVMFALGWLITRPLAHVWPLANEDTVDRTLAAHRDAILNTLTSLLSTVADTPCTVLLAAIAFFGARWIFHHWWASGFIALALAVEVSVFLLTTLLVHRARPAAFELDHSPPTSSFPSGHTAAAVVLYGAVAWLIFRKTARRASWLLLLMPVAVGFARLYRGMHHPSDVLAGCLLGACALLVGARAMFDQAPAASRGAGLATMAKRRARVTLAGGRR